MNEQTKVNRFKSVASLLRMLKPYRFKMFLSIVNGIVKELSIIAAVGIAAFTVAMVMKGADLEWKKWLIGLLAMALLRAVTTYFESFISHDVAYHALIDYRLKLYDRFVTLCPDILLKNRSGQVATTLMNDVEQLEWFYGHTIGYFIVVFVVAVVVLGFLFAMHPLLGVVSVTGVILMACVPAIMKGKADKQGVESRFRLGEANSVTLEGVNGMNEILTLNWQDRYKKKNKTFMSLLTDIQVRYARRMGVESAMLNIVSGVFAAAVNVVGVWLLLNGRIEAQWYAVVGTTVWLAFTPVLAICIFARNFGNVFAASARIEEVLESDPIVRDDGEKTDASKLSASVEFKDVTFRYLKDTDPVLNKVSFDIAEGEIVALVGESGAGKTTCTSLLTRLWDVDDGCISIGGRDIRSMKIHDLHSIISVVLQDVYMFNESIRDNICLGDKDADMDRVIEAAKMARVHDFIMSLPDGYDTIAGERGLQLSGGQRQRIAIARALLKDSPILVMDEAVSNLDTTTDKEIQETIRHLAHKKTILMVAHRLSTIREADKLIVMNRGNVVQVGSHKELLAEDGYYKELISAQIS